MTTEVKIVLGLVLGGLMILSAIKSMFSIGLSRVDVPKRYVDYASAGVKGRNVFKGPGKPILASIFGGLLTLCLWILGIPQKIANWIILRSKSEANRSNKKVQKRAKTLSYIIAVVFWLAITVLVLWPTWWFLEKQTDVGIPTSVLFLILFTFYYWYNHFFFLEYII